MTHVHMCMPAEMRVRGLNLEHRMLVLTEFRIRYKYFLLFLRPLPPLHAVKVEVVS